MQAVSPNHQRISTQPTPSSSTLTRPERSPKLAVPSASRNTPTSPRRHASPCVTVSRPTQDADHEDFSLRLKISSSLSPILAQPAHKQCASSKLFNPNTDPIPMRRTAEPEVMSDGTSSSYVHVPHAAASGPLKHRDKRCNFAWQLFDHPFFCLSTVPAPRSQSTLADAQISRQSHAASISCSAFTFSSTADGSSASSALFDGSPNHGPGIEDSGNTVLSLQLKKLYRNITNLETKIKQQDSTDKGDDASRNTRVVVKGKEVENEDLEKETWKKQISITKSELPSSYLFYSDVALNTYWVPIDSRTPFTTSSKCL